MIEFFVFLIGLCIGSFLNVVIYRYNTGSTLAGRSKCLSCNKTLAWYELVPLFSFLFQGAKCRKCGSKLSWQYPLVEFVTGAIFVALYEKMGVTPFACIYAILWSMLVVIFVYDLRHKIIPDSLVYACMAVTLALNMFFAHSLAGLLAGPAVALPFILIWLVSRGQWMGFGDVKLALVIGWMLGLAGGYTAITLAFWIGAIIGLILMVFKFGSLGMKSEIPFAPFLIIGIAIVFFGNIHLGDLINLFSFNR